MLSLDNAMHASEQMMVPKRFLKRLGIIDIILIFLVYMAFLLYKPAEGYELDIYSVYPLAFWILVISIIIISIVIITLSEYWKIYGYWQMALFSILLLYSIVLLLPLLRGYYMFALGSFDVFVHLANAQNILNTGHTYSYYPGIHVLLTSYHYITGISLENCSMIISTIFTVCYILFLCVLGRSIQAGSWISLLSVLFALTLLYNNYFISFHVFFFGLFLIPIFLYSINMFLKSSRRYGYGIIAILFLFTIHFFHVLISIFLLGLLIILLIGELFSIKQWRRKVNTLISISSFIFILTILTITWQLLFDSLTGFYKRILETFLVDTLSSTTALDSQINMIESSGVNVYHVLELFIKVYGPSFSYLILGLICVFIVLIDLKSKQKSGIEFHLSLQYLFAILIALIMMVNYVVINEPMRLAAVAILLSTILVPNVLSRKILNLSSEKTRKIVFFTLTIFFIFIVTLSLFTVFTGPILYQSSFHMTHMENNGLNWLLQNREDNIPVLVMSYTYYHKYEQYYYEKTFLNRGSRPNEINYNRGLIPNHFGYDFNPTLGASLNFKEFYYISSELNRQHHLPLPEDRKERFTQKVTNEDFERLKNDNSIDLLYSNSEFESWLTKTIR